MLQNKLRHNVYSFLISYWYNYLPKVDHHREVLFLNYGYARGEDIELREEDEVDRYGIQLYHNTVRKTDLKGMKILEVGCGRGGGASYMSRYFQPALLVGLDKSKEIIRYNISHYQDKTLCFIRGDAHAIPFASEHFDVLLNVESSHLYLNFNQFMAEVKRVLKPGGYFLFTDFRLRDQIQKMFTSFENSGLQVVEQEDITSFILMALDVDFERRMRLVKKILPEYLHRWALHYAGVRGSGFYKSFKNGERKYFYVRLRKPMNPGDM